MKGIVMAGGKGTRLYPVTRSISKQILPVYDKPLIYYPISVLLLAGIRDIAIITSRRDVFSFRELLGDGSRFGVRFEYLIQEEPRGLADAFIVGEEFIGDDSVCLILGDNVFYRQGFTQILENVITANKGATIFGFPVNDPSDYGVIGFDDHMNVISVEEKPDDPKSNYVIPGLYFYDNEVVNIAKNIEPSSRNELEITEVNKEYLKAGRLKVELLGRGMIWLDTGSPERLLEASELVKTIQTGQGYYIACLEEIAWRKGFISEDMMRKSGEELKDTEYGKYLLSLK